MESREMRRGGEMEREERGVEIEREERGEEMERGEGSVLSMKIGRCGVVCCVEKCRIEGILYKQNSLLWSLFFCVLRSWWWLVVGLWSAAFWRGSSAT